MQGRLVEPVEGRIQAFPREQWAVEFPNAAAAGLEAIEWIYDTYGLGANPLENPQGISRINQLSRNHGVAVRSVCADYFMDFAFVRASEADRALRLDKLVWLLGEARQIGVTRIVLPFVDQSAICNEADRDAVVEVLQRVLPVARSLTIELHLETGLAPDDFAALLARVPDPFVKVNYDSGNSSSLGYRPSEELAAYGRRLGSVHIKDRVRGAGTVPLGQGDANFDELFTGLRSLNYQGDFILQVARATASDEVAWARHNVAFIKRYWN
ncbi:MAG: sugar phosphate isomerase/epimerase [Acidobacteriia bacterium]|nr:sugar phosphate isomerase/epimerase [Terriglobia bacterium]